MRRFVALFATLFCLMGLAACQDEEYVVIGDAPASSVSSADTSVPESEGEAEEPLPQDVSGAVRIVATEDGQSTMALGPTDAYLANGSFSCGGLKDAPWLQDENLFEASPLLAAYRDRPKYQDADRAFWEEQLGNELFEGLVEAATVNPRFSEEISDENLMEDFASKLLLFRPTEPVTTRNFSCKDDVIRPNGFLKIGEDGQFAAFAGLVMEAKELDDLLLGKSRDGLPVFVYDLGNGDVFVAFKAAGCLNNEIKPPPPPPPPVESTTTTTVPGATTTTTTVPGTTTTTTVPETTTTTSTVPESTTTTTVPQCEGDKPRWDPELGQCMPPFHGGTTLPPPPVTAATSTTVYRPPTPPSTAAPDTLPPGVTPTTHQPDPPVVTHVPPGGTETTVPHTTVAPAPAPPNTEPSTVTSVASP